MMDTFELHFVPRKNVYTRGQDSTRVQQASEAVDSFITALYALAENCNYGALHDELIRDHLVVGLRDTGLAERMQLDKDLTLEKAVSMARQSEVIKRQQMDLRGETRNDIDAVTSRQRKQKMPFSKTPNQQKHTSTKSKAPQDLQSCYRCGKSPGHGKWQCPARDETCHTCRKKEHYSKVCRSAKEVHVVETTQNCNDTPLFLCTVDTGTDPWYTDMTIRNHKIRFKIDTGADVSVMPAQTYYTITEKNTQLAKSDRRLIGPNGTPLSVLGKYTESLCRGERVILEDVYVIKDLHIALLSRPASVKLKLVFN